MRRRSLPASPERAKGFDALVFLDRKEALRTDPFIQYAVAAALMAVADAGLSIAPHEPASKVSIGALRTGVLVGSGRAG